jgi:hypothetical protein
VSELQPFDRDQLVEYGHEYPGLQEIIIYASYSMDTAGHALALAGPLRLVDHTREPDDVFPGRNTGYVSTAPCHNSIEEIPGDECYVELTVLMDHASPSSRSP